MKCSKLSRMISLLLALVLCLSLLPATALAVSPVAYWAPTRDSDQHTPLNSFDDVQSYASKEGYICLQRDLIVPSPLRISANVTLDLNGQVVFRRDGRGGADLIKENGDYTSRNSGEVILVPKGAVLTVVDSEPNEFHIGEFVKPDGKSGNGEIWRIGTSGNPLYGGIITGGSGYNCGGGIQVDGGKVLFMAGSIAGNLSVSGGGGVQICDNGTFEMYGGSIYGNTAVNGLTGGKNGGGIDVENGRFIMHAGTLERNFSAGNGGAVYVDKTVDRSIYLDGTVNGDWNDGKSYPIQIVNNKAKNGGAIFVNNTKVAKVSGAYFKNNRSTSDGGAVYVNTGDGVTFSGCLLTNNNADGSGGAFYLNKGNVTITNSMIRDNRASNNGGGVCNDSTNSMSDTTITNNLCVQQGSGVYDGGKLSISGKMVIKDNAGDNMHTGSNRNLGASGMDASSEVWITVPTESRTNGAILSRSVTNARPEVFHIDRSDLYVAYGNDPADAAKFRKLYVTSTDPGTVKWSNVSLSAAGKNDPSHPLADSVTENGYTNEYTGASYDMQRGYYRFESTDNAGGYSEGLAAYYYSDGMFAQDPVIYSEQLATMTLALTTTAATMPDEHGNDVEDYTNRFGFLLQTLSDLGFADEDIQINDWYTKRPTENSIGVAVAAKKLAVGTGLSTEDTTLYLVPIMIRGSGYEKEWMSNVTISEGIYGMSDRKHDESAGFAQSADIALSELNRYLESHPEVAKAVAEGRVKFWIGGHSRGAAVSNIIAKRLTDFYCNYNGSPDGTIQLNPNEYAWTYTYPEAGGIRNVSGHRFGTKEQHNQVYAFTAGTPQGGTPESRYSAEYTYYGGYFNIHNSIDAADVVVYVAPSAMGFIRYGVDHYVPGYYSVPDKGKVEKGGIGGIRISDIVVEGPYGVRVDQNTLTRYGLTQYADNYPLTKSNDGVYDANSYLPVRREMVSQLRAVAPNNVLEDYWHGGTISAIAGKVGLYDFINETSFHHDDLRTANVFLPNFLDMVVTYTASATGAGYRGYNGVQ